SADATSPCGIGEATPLPGYSGESFHDTQAALKGLGTHLTLPAEPVSPMEWLAVAGRYALPPSAQFALESALLHAWTSLHGGSPSPEATPSPSAPVPCATLIACEDLGASSPASAGCVKCKVGSDLPAELSALLAFRNGAGAHVALRLDANRTLAPDALKHPAFQALQLEFLEEPCRLVDLGPPGPLPVPLALDESFRLEPAAALLWLTSGHVAA